MLGGLRVRPHTAPRTCRIRLRLTPAPIGNVVRASARGRTIDVVFKGRAAHAGLAPEEGRSAIVAAARAISDLRLGRIDDETTANVGRISGGTARNVIPERCELAVEARSRDQGKLADLVQEMVDCFSFAASVSECEVETTISESIRGYRFRADEPAFQLASRAWSGPGSRRRRWTRVAARTRTSSTPAVSHASISPTA